MKYLDVVKKWPIEKKRNFSIIVAVFLTFLIIGVNYGVNLVWHDEAPVNVYSEKDNPLNKLSEAFKKNLDIVQPVLDKALTNMQSPTTTATSSSLSTSSNVVE